METVSWGVLGASNFARSRTIPAMVAGRHCRIDAIASRTLAKAREQADLLGIPRAYGAYEELLDDPRIEAVYIPLANHLHVEWCTKAAEAGKHVLCEKPIGMTAAEAETLLAVRDRTGRMIMEAFMVRTHPQWLRARELVAHGAIGEVCAIQTCVGYHNVNPADIRNRLEVGGGGLMDIGCYAVTIARFVLGREPTRVMAAMDRDPGFGTDRFCSAIMDFAGIQASFVCYTQSQPTQRVLLLGTEGSIEIEVAITPPPDQPSRIVVRRGSPIDRVTEEVVSFEPCNQYTIQGDLFSQAIRRGRSLHGQAQATPLEDAVANMRVIDAIFRAAESANWETV